MKQKIYTTLCIALSFLLMSCANEVGCAVTTFHQLPLPNGETIRLEPSNPDKWGSLEYEQYAAIIASNLREAGYNPVRKGEAAELIAEIDYKIALNKIETVRHPGSYVHYSFYYGYYNRPYYRGLYTHWEPIYYTETVYTRSLSLNVVKTEGRRGPDRTVLFEGIVTSTGRESNLHEIMPYMVTAMFTNFPGESGITKVVTLEKNK